MNYDDMRGERQLRGVINSRRTIYTYMSWNRNELYIFLLGYSKF